MSFTPTRRLINPRLGVYFAIFASAHVGLCLLALIGEQVGAPQIGLRWALLVVPMVFYAGIGVAGATDSSLDYFAAGRRVPAVYSGFSLAVSAFGGTGLVAISGVLFLAGFDALCLVIGGLAGFVVMGILLAPFFRKFGAYTIPTYLGRRFESPTLRAISAVIVGVSLMLMLMAEIKMATFAAGFLVSAPRLALIAGLGAYLLITLMAGGMRALTWSSVAQAIAALLALVAPITIVAVMWTNLPLPQLSHGPLMRGLARNEAIQGLPLMLAQGFTFDLPGAAVSSITKRFATTFGMVGPSGFVAALLSIMMGVAAAPWLLPRIATAPGVYQARKSLAWATLVFGLMMLTLASIAVFSRTLLLDGVMGGTIPDWLRQLAAMGLADVDIKPLTGPGESNRNILTSIGISRDVVLFSLPMAAGLSQTFVALAVVGAIAACLTGASAAATALAALVSEDLVNAHKAEAPHDRPRLVAARSCLIAVVGMGCAFAAVLPGDSLDYLLWSLALTASTVFPVLLFSIWWKRTNGYGAVAGMTSGFGVALVAMVAGGMEWLPFDPALAGVFGIPAAVIATMAATLSTPHPSRHVLELVRDIRVPGGEIIYDREMRLLRLKKRERASDPV